MIIATSIAALGYQGWDSKGGYALWYCIQAMLASTAGFDGQPRIIGVLVVATLAACLRYIAAPLLSAVGSIPGLIKHNGIIASGTNKHS